MFHLAQLPSTAPFHPASPTWMSAPHVDGRPEGAAMDGSKLGHLRIGQLILEVNHG